MLQRSDNVATNQLYDVLGRERATADVHALGFPDVFFRRKLSGALPLIDDPQATGRNAFSGARGGRALRGDRPGPRSRGARRCARILATSWWDVKLSRGLEPGDAFAHKTGDTDEVAHDGGILTLAGFFTLGDRRLHGTAQQRGERSALRSVHAGAPSSPLDACCERLTRPMEYRMNRITVPALALVAIAALVAPSGAASKGPAAGKTSTSA